MKDNSIYTINNNNNNNNNNNKSNYIYIYLVNANNYVFLRNFTENSVKI
jgi:hypothetical protein